MTAKHGSFTIERTLAASPERVFRAWSDVEAKARWFAGPAGWKPLIRELDFRPGGHERTRGQFPDGKTSDFKATYYDIVPGRRIVYAYEMFVNDVKISVSLATITIEPAGSGTRMSVTEQGVFFEDLDRASGREEGTKFLMDQLAKSLA